MLKIKAEHLDGDEIMPCVKAARALAEKLNVTVDITIQGVPMLINSHDSEFCTAQVIRQRRSETPQLRWFRVDMGSKEGGVCATRVEACSTGAAVGEAQRLFPHLVMLGVY